MGRNRRNHIRLFFRLFARLISYSRCVPYRVGLSVAAGSAPPTERHERAWLGDAMLATVFLVHRFVAGGFGVLLLLLPTELNAVMSPGRVLPLEEKLTLQSWAAFMLGVAYIAHQAPSLPLSAQTAIARGLALCFMIETVLYGYYAAFGLASSSPEYRVGVICTGSIFVVLWAAYSAALLGASVPAAPKKS